LDDPDGSVFFGDCLIFFGLEQVLHPEFAPGVPDVRLTPLWVPLHALWGYPVGASLLVVGAGLLINIKIKPRTAAGWIGVLMTLLTTFLYLPILALTRDPSQMTEAINYVADTLMFGGTALLLAGALRRRSDGSGKPHAGWGRSDNIISSPLFRFVADWVASAARDATGRSQFFQCYTEAQFLRGKFVRLIILMVEVEQPEGISARKLILETARHNVISAYCEEDAVELLRRFPGVDLAVVHTELEDSAFESTVRRLKEVRPDLYIIAISPVGAGNKAAVNSVLSSHDPQELLEFLAKRFHAATSDGK
jgi:hypothetical protein